MDSALIQLFIANQCNKKGIGQYHRTSMPSIMSWYVSQLLKDMLDNAAVCITNAIVTHLCYNYMTLLPKLSDEKN